MRINQRNSGTERREVRNVESNQILDCVRLQYRDQARVVKGLKHFRHRGCDVLVFHVLDRAELTFPFDRPVRFKDLEDASELVTNPARVRESYLAAINAFIDTYRRELGAAGIDYQVLDTSQPLDKALLTYLSTRGRRR